MMCTTCLAAKLVCGAMESTIATGPSTGTSSPRPISSASSRYRASTRLSPEWTPPPGSSQYSLPCFSWRQSRRRSGRRRIAETRILGSPGTSAPSDPRGAEPSSPPLAPGQLGQLHELDGRHRQDDELRDAHPRLDDERRGPVGVQQHDLHLTAVARV